mmetsp:Transcript_149772/g.480995  ORF Transcript_149772/g.480995 Transcript_149772/m.480995 type:complete len:535 (+) Transcript_149772:1-1605(+)
MFPPGAYVGSDEGLDGRPRRVANTYTELFERAARGSDYIGKRRAMPPLLLAAKASPDALGLGPDGQRMVQPRPPLGCRKGPGGRQRHGVSARWRAEGLCSMQEVAIAEDPVQAILEDSTPILLRMLALRKLRPDAAPLGSRSGIEDPKLDSGEATAGEETTGEVGLGMVINKRGSLKGLLSKHRNSLRGEMRRTSTGLEDLASPGSAKEEQQMASNLNHGGRGTRLLSVLEAAVPKVIEVTSDRKEACQMLRFFTFGNIGNESCKTAKEKEQIFSEPIGQTEVVRSLFILWSRLDEDGSGRVDIGEFREFAQVRMRECFELAEKDVGIAALPAWLQFRSDSDMKRFIGKLCDKLVQLLLGKKSSFTIDDMMKVIWPCAQVSDLREMRKWCKEFSKAVDKKRVRTPPVLPLAEFEGLCSVFQFFDDDGSGSVQMDELISKGLIYEDQAEQYKLEWDTNGDGVLDLYEFCEMMCPVGYRAHEKSLVGSSPEGVKLVFDTKLDCWRVADGQEAGGGQGETAAAQEAAANAAAQGEKA